MGDLKEALGKLADLIGDDMTVHLEVVEHSTKAMIAVKAKHPGTPESRIQGQMECSLCGGVVRYVVSDYNGHSHGSCEKENCVDWMQ